MPPESLLSVPPDVINFLKTLACITPFAVVGILGIYGLGYAVVPTAEEANEQMWDDYHGK